MKILNNLEREYLVTICNKIKQAFKEGYNSYETPSLAYNTIESAWENSDAKKICDRLLK